MLTRLSFIFSIALLPALLASMFITLSGYIIPLAACSAVQLVCIDIFVRTDLLIFYFFHRLRKSFFVALFLFSLSLTTLFIPLIFFIIPSSQNHLRVLLVDIATKQIEQFEPGVMHKLTDGVSLWFAKKKIIDQSIHFERLFFTLPFKNQQDIFVFVATTGSLKDQSITLFNGSFSNQNSHKKGVFDTIIIDLKQFVTPLQKSTTKAIRSMNIVELYGENCKKMEVMLEYNKRISQSIWLLMLPFLGFFFTFLWGLSKGRGFLITFSSSGILFFISYACSLCAQALVQNPVASVAILYGPLIIITVTLLLLYYNKQ